MVGHETSIYHTRAIFLRVLLLFSWSITYFSVAGQQHKTLNYSVKDSTYQAKISFNTFLLSKNKKEIKGTTISTEEVTQFEALLLQPIVQSIAANHKLTSIKSTSKSRILTTIDDPTVSEILYNVDAQKLPGTENLSLFITIDANGQLVEKTVNLTYQFAAPSKTQTPELSTKSSPSENQAQETQPSDNPGNSKKESKDDVEAETATNNVQEQKIWSYVHTSDTYLDYYQYVWDYPDGLNHDIAIQRLIDLSKNRRAAYKLSYSEGSSTPTYTLTLDTTVYNDELYSLLPPLALSHSYDEQSLSIDSLSINEFAIYAHAATPLELMLADYIGRTQTIILQEHIIVDDTLLTGNAQPEILDAFVLDDTIFIEIVGGANPYTLWMEQADSSIVNNDSLPSTTLQYKNDYLYYSDSRLDVEIFQHVGQISVSDSFGIYSAPYQLKLAQQQDIPSRTWILIGIALGLIIITTIVVATQKRKKTTVDGIEEEEVEEEEVSNIHVSNVSVGTEPKAKKIKSVKSRSRLVSELAMEDYGPLSEEHKGKGWLASQVLPLSEEEYLCIDLEELWENTAVGNLFMKKSSIQELDVFITEKNNPEFSEDSQGVPEIGGFFLGNYFYNEDQSQYHVALEKFVPVNSEEYDVYKLEFGIEAWKTLADVQDNYTDLETLAWFHTHPGHGLFLSQADLKIHQGFFKKRYQLAIEIDTLSDGLDIAFFTRTLNGDVNNNIDLRSDASWKKWNELKHLMDHGN